MIDTYAETLSKRMGHEGETNWKIISKVVLIVYLLFTMLSCYYRPDFMSLTAVCGALFFFEKPQHVRRKEFLLFVCFLASTFVFDALHLFVLHDSRADDEQDSDMTKSVRQFSYLFVWISFIFRPIVVIVMFRNYQSFMKLVKGKDEEADHILQAMAKYGVSDHLQVRRVEK